MNKKKTLKAWKHKNTKSEICTLERRRQEAREPREHEARKTGGTWGTKYVRQVI